MATRSKMLFALALAFAAIAAGCGGSDGDSSATGASSITKAQFIKQANAICSREQQGILGGFNVYLVRHQGSKSEDEVFADMMRVVLLPVVKKDIAELRALGAPPGDKARVEAFLDAQQRAVVGMAKVKRLAKGPSGERFFEPASRIAKAYGIPDCAQS